MSHVFGSRSTICQYKGVTRGVSAYQFGGGAACYPKYTKSFGDARSAFAFLPSPCHPPVLPDRPSPSAILFHPLPAPARPGYNARQIDDSIEYQRIHCVAHCIRWAKDQFKRIMEIDSNVVDFVYIGKAKLRYRNYPDNKMTDQNANILFISIIEEEQRLNIEEKSRRKLCIDIAFLQLMNKVQKLFMNKIHFYHSLIIYY